MKKIHLNNCHLYWVYDFDLAQKLDPHFAIFKSIMESDLVDIVQFRAKNLTLLAYQAWCEELLKNLPSTKTLRFSNDHASVLSELSLDGVHVGDEDMPVADAQKLYPNHIIGATARSFERAKQAFADGAHYLGAGTVFETTTKQGLISKGVDFIVEMQQMVDIPVFAIGGIDSGNVEQLVEKGIRRVAVASSILKVKDPLEEVLLLKARLTQ
jgi:thiamine-phosphate pyrophosphorylase